MASSAIGGAPGVEITEAVRRSLAVSEPVILLADKWAGAEPIAAAEWINREDFGGDERSHALVGFMRGVAARDPQLAVSMIDKIGDAPAKLASAIAMIEGLGDRGMGEIATQWLLGQVPNNADGALDAAFNYYFGKPDLWTAADRETQVKLILGTNDPQSRIASARRLISVRVETSPAEAIETSRSILPESELWAKDNSPLARSLGMPWAPTSLPGLVRRWASRDRDTARSFVLAMPDLTSEQRDLLLSVASTENPN